MSFSPIAHYWPLIHRLFSASWGQVVAAALLLLGIRLYTGLMPLELFGQAMLVLGLLALADGMGSMALGQTIAQIGKDYTPADRIAVATGMVRLMQPKFAAAVLFISAAGSLIGAVDLAVTITLAAAYSLAEPWRICGQTLLTISRRYAMSSIWTASEAALILSITLILIFQTQSSATSLIAGAVLGRSIMAAIFWFAVFGSSSMRYANMMEARKQRSRAINFAGGVAMMAPLGWLGAYADRYIVGGLSGLAAAGIFAALGGVVGRPFGIVSAGLTNYFRADLLDKAAGRSVVHLDPLRNWIGIALLIGGIGTFLFVIFSRQIAVFFLNIPNPGLRISVVIILLAVSQCILILSHAFENQALALGCSTSLLRVQLLTLVFGLACIAGGAWSFGMVGAALGRVINEALRLSGCIWLTRRP